MENCLTFKYIAVDTEGFTADSILGLSIAHPALDSIYYPLGHKEDVNVDNEVRSLINHVLQTVPYRVFHNASHDLTILPDLFDLPFFDTMIGGHMVDENLWSKSLDAMHKWYCPDSAYSGKEMDPLMASIIKIHGWEMVPYPLMYKYGRVDAIITMELFLKIKPIFEEQYGPFWS